MIKNMIAVGVSVRDFWRLNMNEYCDIYEVHRPKGIKDRLPWKSKKEREDFRAEIESKLKQKGLM